MSVPVSAALPACAVAAAAPRRGLPAGLRRGGIALRSFAIFIAAWWLLSKWNNNPIQLPDPLSVARAMAELTREGEVWEHASISTGRLLMSLAIATLVAVPLGFLMGLSRRVAFATCRPSSTSPLMRVI